MDIGYDMNGHGKSVPTGSPLQLPSVPDFPQMLSLRQEAIEMRRKVVCNLFVQLELHC
jgi:hypothetical protein